MRRVVVVFWMSFLPQLLAADCQEIIYGLPDGFSAEELISHIVQIDAQGNSEAECLLRFYEKTYVSPAPFSLHAQYYYNHRANQAVRRSVFDTAFHYVKLALRCDSLLSDNFYLSSDLGVLGNIHLAKGDFEKAIEYLEQSINLLDAKKHPAVALSNLSNLGVAYLKTQYFETAMQYFKQALAYGEYATTPYAARSRSVVRLNIGIIHKKQENYQQAVQVFQALLDTAQLQDYPYLSYLSHFNVAQVYRELKEKEAFQNHLDTAWVLARENQFGQHYLLAESIDYAYEQQDWKKLRRYLEDYREYYEEEGLECDPDWAIWNSRLRLFEEQQPKTALSLLTEGINCGEFYTTATLEMYELRSEAYQQLGRYKQALGDMLISKQLADSLVRRSNRRILSDMTTSYRVSQYQKMLQQQEKEKVWLLKRASYNKRIAFGLGIIMVLSFFLFYFYRQKMQYKKEALEARQQQLEALSKMRYEELSRHKHRLLKQSVQTNQLRAKILDICDRYRRNTSMLVRKVEMAFREQPVWEDFLLDFNQNYPGFIDNMLRKYPDISKRQLQYIVLIALGFNNQEISEMLFVTLSGVEKAKIRLAQQLCIEDKKKLSREIRSLFFQFTQRTGEKPV